MCRHLDPARRRGRAAAFFGLFAPQHRGQEAAGIAVSDGRPGSTGGRPRRQRVLARDPRPARRLPLDRPHRYSTTGSNASITSAFLIETCTARALAHNGNLVNAAALRDGLLNRGFGLTATRDSEVLSLMLAAAGGQTWQDRIQRTLPAWKGLLW